MLLHSLVSCLSVGRSVCATVHWTRRVNIVDEKFPSWFINDEIACDSRTPKRSIRRLDTLPYQTEWTQNENPFQMHFNDTDRYLPKIIQRRPAKIFRPAALRSLHCSKSHDVGMWKSVPFHLYLSRCTRCFHASNRRSLTFSVRAWPQ